MENLKDTMENKLGRLMKYIRKIIIGIVLLLLFALISNYDIKNFECVQFITLWHNLKLISAAIYVLFPTTIVLIIVILLFTNKWSLHVEKFSIGGFSILFDNPAKLYKRQVKNYLDSKRTIFKINTDYDNFKETFDSYFEIYRFFRDEIKILGNVQLRRFADTDSIKLYTLTNEILKVLNKFLTENQNDYRRWYIYIEKIDQKKYYLTPIGTLQKEYKNYQKLCNDFKKVNEFFTEKVACEFKINVEKWNNLEW